MATAETMQPTPFTLAQLIEIYRAEQEQESRKAEERAAHAEETYRERTREEFVGQLDQFISPEMLTALALTLECIEDDPADVEEWGQEQQPWEAVFTHGGDEWRISRRWRRQRTHAWKLVGPEGYWHQMSEYAHGYEHAFDPQILQGIAQSAEYIATARRRTNAQAADALAPMAEEGRGALR